MKPITFPEANFTYTPAKGTEDKVQPLPCYRDKLQTISLWELTDEEVEYIVQNRKIYVSQWNCGDPLQPLLPIAGPINFPAAYLESDVWYRAEGSLRNVKVWVSGNFDLPAVISIPNRDETAAELMYFDNTRPPQRQPGKALNVDDLYFRLPTVEEGIARAEAGIKEYEGSEMFQAHTQPERAEFIQQLKKHSLQYPVLVKKLQAGKELILC